MPPIARAIRANFACPVLGPRSDAATTVNAVRASMPETAVHEDTNKPVSKDKIWFSGKIFGVQPISQTPGMKKPTNEKFGLGILASDRRHNFAAAFLRNGVHK